VDVADYRPSEFTRKDTEDEVSDDEGEKEAAEPSPAEGEEV